MTACTVACFFRFRFFLDLDLLCISCGCVVKSCACQLYIKRIYDDGVVVTRWSRSTKLIDAELGEHLDGWPLADGWTISVYVVSHPGQLSLAVPQWVGAISSSESTPRDALALVSVEVLYVLRLLRQHWEHSNVFVANDSAEAKLSYQRMTGNGQSVSECANMRANKSWTSLIHWKKCH